MKAKIFFSILLFDVISNSIYAQSIYHFKYEVPAATGSVAYEAFFERDLDGTGFIRVKYINPETNKEMLIDLETEDAYYKDKKGHTDSSMLYFEGSDPEVKKGDKNNKYVPQIFWFKIDNATGYYEPWGVTSSDDNPEAEGTFTYSKLLTKEDLTQELVSGFFTKDEGLYENLFDTASVRRPTTNPLQKSVTLHLVIVANTEDNTIGTTCIRDKDRTIKAFTELTDYLGIQLSPTTIFGNKYNKEAVQVAIQYLQPAPDDIVVFYYSGHGFSNNGNSRQYPYLDLRPRNSLPLEGNSLNIEDIYNSIKKKGARLNIIFSDCCNADPNAASNISGNIAQTRSTSMGWSMENCRSLFMDQKPHAVLMTAATKGELSAGNDNTGGIFTFNFGESLQSYFGLFYKNVTWANVLQQAQKQTINTASNTLCPQADEKTYKPCVQHPIFKID